MSQSKVLVITNPESGNGRSSALLLGLEREPSSVTALVKALNAVPISEWPIVETTFDGTWKATVEIHLRTRAFAAVIVIGGDGTLMEVAALIQKIKPYLENVPALVPLPGGRGNDFVRGAVGYDRSDGDFWTWLGPTPRWHEEDLDLVDINGWIFINVASLGYGGKVVENTHHRKAFWSKTPLVYQVEGGLALFSSPEITCRVEADGKTIYNGPFFGSFIGNGKANGSGLYWTARAEIGDGMVDAVIFRKPGVLEMTKSLLAVKKKKPPTFEHVYATASKFQFEFEKPVPLEIDGDYVGDSSRYGIFCLPKALKVWLPK